MAKLDNQKRVLRSGQGMPGLYVSWLYFQDWLSIEIPQQRARLIRLVK